MAVAGAQMGIQQRPGMIGKLGAFGELGALG